MSQACSEETVQPICFAASPPCCCVVLHLVIHTLDPYMQMDPACTQVLVQPIDQTLCQVHTPHFVVPCLVPLLQYTFKVCGDMTRRGALKTQLAWPKPGLVWHLRHERTHMCVRATRVLASRQRRIPPPPASPCRLT